MRRDDIKILFLKSSESLTKGLKKTIDSSVFKIGLSIFDIDTDEKALKISDDRPDFIFIDMTKRSARGLDLVRIIKEGEKSGSIPVIVFGAKSSSGEVCSAYDRGANCYIRAESSGKSVFKAMCAVEKFWFSVARLPSKGI